MLIRWMMCGIIYHSIDLFEETKGSIEPSENSVFPCMQGFFIQNAGLCVSALRCLCAVRSCRKCFLLNKF
uniref:Uncharacterized protein n=1 Tax=Oryza brachyantha TaxID=4533 RepID=J3LPP8_ORYBR